MGVFKSCRHRLTLSLYSQTMQCPSVSGCITALLVFAGRRLWPRFVAILQVGMPSTKNHHLLAFDKSNQGGDDCCPLSLSLSLSLSLCLSLSVCLCCVMIDGVL